MKEMTTEFVQLNQGFWSLVDKSGNKYEPINMPEQLKKSGKRSKIWYNILQDASSINMYGQIIEITGFSVE